MVILFGILGILVVWMLVGAVVVGIMNRVYRHGETVSSDEPMLVFFLSALWPMWVFTLIGHGIAIVLGRIVDEVTG